MSSTGKEFMEMCKNFASGVTSVITGVTWTVQDRTMFLMKTGFVINVVNVAVFIYS